MELTGIEPATFECQPRSPAPAGQPQKRAVQNACSGILCIITTPKGRRLLGSRAKYVSKKLFSKT